MALVLADRIRETSTTTGTGAITLAGAVTGYRTFATVGNGNTTYYTIAGQTTSEWEVGIGTYTSAGTTLSRDTVLASSNSGSLVTFSAGTKDVFVTYPAGKSVNQDSSGNVTVVGQIRSSGSTSGLYAEDRSTANLSALYMVSDIARLWITTKGDVLTFNTSGNVTIGAATSGVSLAVSGDVTITGKFGVGSSPSYGTAGQVLTSGGSGTAPSWADASGAPSYSITNDSGSFGIVSFRTPPANFGTI